MVIRIKRQLIILFFIYFPTLVNGQNDLPFHVGEKLTYDASFNFITAGQAKLFVSSLDTINNSDVYHIIFSVKTNNIADRIYKIRDRVDTWVDTEGLFTRKLKKKIREGRYRKKFQAMVNYQDSVIISNGDTIKVEKELRDPYSLLMYIRATPFKVDDLFSFTTFDENEFTDFQVIVHKKQKIKVPAGKFDCYVIEPFHPDRPLFKSKGDMTIWLSDDDRRLPVKIRSRAKFGSMVLKLREVSP